MPPVALPFFSLSLFPLFSLFHHSYLHLWISYYNGLFPLTPQRPLLPESLVQTCSVQKTGNWFLVQTRARASIKREQDPSLTWNLRKLMSSEPGGSEDKLTNLLAVITEYYVCGALCAWKGGTRVKKEGQNMVTFVSWHDGKWRD